MIHEQLAVGPLQCNCHILGCEETKEGVVIDPGDDPKLVIAAARDLGLTIKAILHTHAHFDHINGTPPVRAATEAPILLHRGDEPLYSAVVAEAGKWGFRALPPSPVDRYIDDGDTVAFGRHTLTVMHTPGHTQGSCCFRIDHTLFSGDTLFCRGIGRTDLWGGNHAQEIASIRERLFTLDEGTLVYPGHGPSTHIGEEKKENPYA